MQSEDALFVINRFAEKTYLSICLLFLRALNRRNRCASCRPGVDCFWAWRSASLSCTKYVSADIYVKTVFKHIAVGFRFESYRFKLIFMPPTISSAIISPPASEPGIQSQESGSAGRLSRSYGRSVLACVRNLSQSPANSV